MEVALAIMPHLWSITPYLLRSVNPHQLIYSESSWRPTSSSGLSAHESIHAYYPWVLSAVLLYGSRIVNEFAVITRVITMDINLYYNYPILFLRMDVYTQSWWNHVNFLVPENGDFSGLALSTTSCLLTLSWPLVIPRVEPILHSTTIWHSVSPPRLIVDYRKHSNHDGHIRNYSPFTLRSESLTFHWDQWGEVFLQEADCSGPHKDNPNKR